MSFSIILHYFLACTYQHNMKYIPYFSNYKTHFHLPQIWEENGGASDSPNVAYLTGWGGGGSGAGGFFSLFSFKT